MGSFTALAAGGFIGILIMICVFIILLAVGGVILRFAVSIFNGFAGGKDSPDAAPMPSLGKAMGIVFIVGLINIFVEFILAMLMPVQVDADEASMAAAGTSLVVSLLSLVIGYLIMSGILKALLPTSMGRAFGVALCWYIAFIIVFIIIAVIVGIIAVALGLGVAAAT